MYVKVEVLLTDLEFGYEGIKHNINIKVSNSIDPSNLKIIFQEASLIIAAQAEHMLEDYLYLSQKVKKEGED